MLLQKLFYAETFMVMVYFEYYVYALECPKKTENSCETFWHKLLKYPGHNLKKGLKCLDYDRHISSNEYHGNGSIPQEVLFDILEVNIVEINEEKRYIIWGYKLKVTWDDLRLEWPNECKNKGNQRNLHIVRSDLLHSIWDPVTVFHEYLEGHPIMEKTITIGENGKVISTYKTEEKYYDQIHAGFSMKFDFTWYPFDVQKVIVPVTTEWKTEEWHFKGHGFNATNVLTNDWEVDISYGIPRVITMENQNKGTLLTFSAADNIYLFKRPLANHFLQTFIPSMMLTAASISSVFIPCDIVPGRMALCITSFLSLISLFNGARSNWTKTTHLRAIDIWVILCYIGVFSALMEYCLILYLTKSSILDNKFGSKPKENYEVANQDGEEKSKEGDMERNLKVANDIEKVTRIILTTYLCTFPICYLVICTSIN